MQNFQAKTRESLGIRPEYGAPVMMPPSDRLSGALSIASSVAGIVSGFGGLGALGGTNTALSSFQTMSPIMNSAFSPLVTPANMFNPSFVGGVSPLQGFT